VLANGLASLEQKRGGEKLGHEIFRGYQGKRSIAFRGTLGAKNNDIKKEEAWFSGYFFYEGGGGGMSESNLEQLLVVPRCMGIQKSVFNALRVRLFDSVG